MSWQFNFTENGTTTLATEGKYCDRNIDINVDVEGEGGGAYDITATANDDGTQSLAVVDAGSGGSSLLLSQITIDCTKLNPAQQVWVNYLKKDQEWSEWELTILGGNAHAIETPKGALFQVYPNDAAAFGSTMYAGPSEDTTTISQASGNIYDTYFKQSGGGILEIYNA